jgi:uncharacterized protein (TIGR02996 family)
MLTLTESLLNLHAVILASPEDDTVRLVYADALDDNGDTERAEFIRVGVALASLVDKPLDPKTLGSGPVLRKRELELLSRHAPEWIPSSRPLLSSQGPEGHDYAERSEAGAAMYSCNLGESLAIVFVYFRRGFIEAVTLTAEAWLEHHGALRASHPLTRVRLTTWPRLRPLAGQRRRLPGGKYSYKLKQVMTVDDLRREREAHPGMGLLEAGNRLMTPHLLKAEWPGITFALPEVPNA